METKVKGMLGSVLRAPWRARTCLAALVLAAVVAAVTAACGAMGAQAAEAWVTTGGVVYTLDTSSKTASVTRCDSDSAVFPADGKLVIPATVTFVGVDYSVTSLGDRCFES